MEILVVRPHVLCHPAYLLREGRHCTTAVTVRQQAELQEFLISAPQASLNTA